MHSKRLLARNVFWNGAGTLFDAVVAFKITPILIQGLGDTTYGLWILIGSLSSYFGLLDIGVRGSVGRFIAFHRGAGDREAVNATISTAMALCCASASIVMVVSVGLQFLFFHFFDVPPSMAAETRLALWLICLNLALTFPLSLFDGVLWASGRFDLLNAVDIPAMFARALLSYFVVTRGHGLVGLAIVTISLTVAVGLVKAAVGFRVDPGIRIRFSLVNMATARTLFGYGAMNLVITIARLTRLQMTTMMIGSIMGAARVTLFSNARKLVDYSERVIVSGSGTLTPLATTIHSQGDSDRQQALLTQGGRFTAAFSFFILGFLATLGRPFLILWLGPRFAFAGDLLLILAFGEVLPLTQSTTGNILMAMARLRLIAVLQVTEVIALLALGLPISREFGLVGFCWVIAAVGLVFRGLFILVYGCRIVGVPVRSYLRNAFLPAAAVAAIPWIVLALVEAASPATQWARFFAYFFMYACLCSVALIPLIGTRIVLAFFGEIGQSLMGGAPDSTSRPPRQIEEPGSPAAGDPDRAEMVSTATIPNDPVP